MRVALRVDSSRTIGGGHVVRCLTLAQALEQSGARCVFVCREMDGDLTSMVLSAGFKLLRLPRAIEPFTAQESEPPHAAWAETPWERDAQDTSRAVRDAFGAAGADWLIYDHYAFDARWAERVASDAPAAHVMAIDDIDDRPLGADIVLDQSRLPPLGPRRFGGPAELIGPAYALLRPEFAALRKESVARRARPRTGAPRILVSTGMMDIGGASLIVIDALAPLDATLDIAVSARAESAGALRDAARRHEGRIRLHLDARNMGKLMVAADLSVGAAGATTWERLCLGLPGIVFVLAENQQPIADGLAAMDLAIVLGRPEEKSADRLRQEAERLLQEPEALRATSARCAEACDGLGVDRVVKALSP